VVTMRQGDIWWLESETERRPVLVVTRSAALPFLQRVVVAPVTRTIRGIRSEILLDEAEGLPQPCVASFDNLTTVATSNLTQYVGTLGVRHDELCRALRFATACS